MPSRNKPTHNQPVRETCTVVAFLLSGLMAMLSVTGLIILMGYLVLSQDTRDCWVVNNQFCVNQTDPKISLSFKSPIVQPESDNITFEHLSPIDSSPDIVNLPEALAYCGHDCCQQELTDQVRLTCFQVPFRPTQVIGLTPHQVASVSQYLLPTALSALGLVGLMLLGVLFVGLIHSFLQKNKHSNYSPLNNMEGGDNPRPHPPLGPYSPDQQVMDFRPKGRKKGRRVRTTQY